MAPPLSGTWLPDRVEPVIVMVEGSDRAKLTMAPPTLVAELSDRVQRVIVIAAWRKLKMAPPSLLELPVRVQSLSAIAPFWLRMAPPCPDELPDRVQPRRINEPW